MLAHLKMLQRGQGVRNYRRRVLKITKGPKRVPNKGKPIDRKYWMVGCVKNYPKAEKSHPKIINYPRSIKCQNIIEKQ